MKNAGVKCWWNWHSVPGFKDESDDPPGTWNKICIVNKISIIELSHDKKLVGIKLNKISV
jgi:hypothetical protein